MSKPKISSNTNIAKVSQHIQNMCFFAHLKKGKIPKNRAKLSIDAGILKTLISHLSTRINLTHIFVLFLLLHILQIKLNT